MSENWRVQISPKLADGTLVNVRAETGEELLQTLAYLKANAAHITSFGAAIQAVSTVQGQLGGEVVAQTVPTQPAYQQPAQPVQQTYNNHAAASAYSPPAPAGAPGPAPLDQFGKPMKFVTGTTKSGPKAGQQWKAWMGDYPKDDPQGKQVEPQWLR